MEQNQREEIVRLTTEYGGDWGINHTRRLLHLIEIIGENLTFDTDIVWLAAHLHDWGGYSHWVQPGVDHAFRSKQVANDFLRDKGFSPAIIEPVLECIENHHQAGSNLRIEAILLRDADALDFLGVVGILRDFAKQVKDLRAAYQTACKRKDRLQKIVHLEKAKEIAAERIQEMEIFLSSFERETFGYF